MTPDKTPSDAELKALLPTKQLARDEEPKVQVWLTQKDAITFARAVLAKWGSPVVAGEPFGYFHQLLDHEGNGNGVWLGTAEREVTEQAHTPGETSEEIVTLYTTPQPTQVQAGAVPLTREQVKAICVESGYETATLQERADFINGIRHAERHHGIKGEPK